MLLEEMTWKEIDAKGPGYWLPVIPTAVLEQHGPHLPIATDCYVAWHVCRGALAEHPRVLLCPVMSYATATPMRNFPGSFIVRPETFMHQLRDVCLSMVRQGFRHALIVNSHGGNTHVAQTALREVAEAADGFKTHFIHLFDMDEPHWTSTVRSRRQGHACWYETSMMLAVRPDLVRMDKKTDGWFPGDGIPCRKEVDWWDWRVETPSGVLGDTDGASSQIGQEILDFLVQKVGDTAARILSERGTIR